MQTRRRNKMIKFEKGQIYTGSDSSIFVKGAYGDMVRFIEGNTPSAIHNMQEIPAENLEEYINKWGFKREDPEYEAFINA